MNQCIIYDNDHGGVCVIIPSPDCGLAIEEIAEKDIPPGRPFEIINADDLPQDRTFRNAWEKSGREVVHNLDKAKAIGHEMRRAGRAAEFAPLDVEATIPAKAAEAEAKRSVIRQKYDAMQVAIDKATGIDQIKEALK